MSLSKILNCIFENLVKSVSLKLVKCIKSVSVCYFFGIKNRYRYVFFRIKKSVSVCYLVLKIGIGKVKIFKIGKNRYR